MMTVSKTQELRRVHSAALHRLDESQRAVERHQRAAAEAEEQVGLSTFARIFWLKCNCGLTC